VHMADAWGRLTGEPGIAMVTGGPGHANAVGALFTALGSAPLPTACSRPRPSWREPSCEPRPQGWLAGARAAIEERPHTWDLLSTTTGKLHPVEVFRVLRPMVARDPATILICAVASSRNGDNAC
jgi:hypothetical protein